MDGTEHRFSPSGRLPGGDFRVRRQFCQQDGAEQQRERAAPPGHVCASAHGGVSGAQSRFAGADCPAGQPCRPADRRARCPADRRAPCRARCPADRRMESVHVSPPPPVAAVYALRRFFMRAGDCPAGACPPPCRLTAPLWCPQGGVSGWLAADRAVPEAARGGVLFFSPPYPAFSFLYCPPSPKGKDRPPPPLAERSSPPGKGETKVFSCKGLRPLHPRG